MIVSLVDKEAKSLQLHALTLLKLPAVRAKFKMQRKLSNALLKHIEI